MLIFFGCLVSGFVFVYFAIPETKGLSLEEVSPASLVFRRDLTRTASRSTYCTEQTSNPGDRPGGDRARNGSTPPSATRRFTKRLPRWRKTCLWGWVGLAMACKINSSDLGPI